NARADRKTPGVVDLDVGLVKVHFSAANVVEAGEEIGTEAVAPVVVRVKLDVHGHFVGEIGLHAQTGALLNVGNVFAAVDEDVVVEVEPVTTDADATVDFDILELGLGGRNRTHSKSCNQKCFK